MHLNKLVTYRSQISSEAKPFLDNTDLHVHKYRAYTKNLIKKIISHPRRAQHTPSAVGTVQVSYALNFFSHALPAVCFS
jgi:hypothetical protein